MCIYILVCLVLSFLIYVLLSRLFVAPACQYAGAGVGGVDGVVGLISGGSCDGKDGMSVGFDVRCTLDVSSLVRTFTCSLLSVLMSPQRAVISPKVAQSETFMAGVVMES